MTDFLTAANASAFEHTHRNFTVHRYLKHEESFDDAALIMKLTHSLIAKGMAHVTRELGFDAWSRNLSDYEPARALLVPENVYMNEANEMADFRDTLVHYIKTIFNVYYIYADIEWRESSADIDYPQNSIYEVDAIGSRSRSVNMGHHLYITFRTRNVGARRPPLDPAPAKLVWPETGGCPHKWSVTQDMPDEAIVNYYVNLEEIRRVELKKSITNSSVELQ